MTSRLVILALVASLAAGVPVAPAEPAVAELPSGRSATSAVFDGESIYVFGGLTPTGRLDEIVRYDPATRQVERLDARLPSPRSGASAVWDGDAVWLFGGRTATGPLDEIVRFDPKDQSVVVAARLPAPRSGTSAVWTGTEALVFGGDGGTWDDELRRIARFTPGAEQASWAPFLLPDLYSTYGVYPEWGGTVAYWEAGAAYVNVPWDCSAWCGSGRVFRVDPDTGTVAWTTLSARYGRGAAAHDGQLAYSIGGFHRGGQTARAQAFDLDAGASWESTLSMTTWGMFPSAAWDGSHVVVFGGVQYGYGRGDTYLRDIVHLAPGAPGPITRVHAAPGATLGEVAVRWDAPSDSGGFAPTAYRVTRALPGEPDVVTVVPGHASGIVDHVPDGARATYSVVALNPKGEGPAGSAAEASGAPSDRAIVILIGDSGPVPPDAYVPYGARATFVRASTAPRTVEDTRTDGACFDFRAANDWRFMKLGEAWDVRFLYDPETKTVHASTDGKTFHACPGADASATAAEAIVPYRSRYYHGPEDARIHALPPP